MSHEQPSNTINPNASEQLAALLQSLVQASGYSSSAATPNSQPPPQPAAEPLAQPIPDPTVITTYVAALQYVIARILPQRSTDIRMLIVEQADLERRCARERVQLIEQQSTRARTRAHLEGVLRMIAGSTGSGGDRQYQNSDEENRKELEMFDNNVYMQLERGARASALRLGDWGVPLFCVRPELVTDQVLADRIKLVQFLQDACQ